MVKGLDGIINPDVIFVIFVNEGKSFFSEVTVLCVPYYLTVKIELDIMLHILKS